MKRLTDKQIVAIVALIWLYILGNLIIINWPTAIMWVISALMAVFTTTWTVEDWWE